MIRKIHWEKWLDPFGADSKNMQWPGAYDKREEEYEQYNDYEDEDEDEKPHHLKQQPMGMLATPVGMIPIDEHTNPTKIFNFWTMHTNFPLTKTIVNIIDTTPGVETFDMFTPYRWRISIGKAFTASEVKIALEDNLDARVVNKDAKKNS